MTLRTFIQLLSTRSGYVVARSLELVREAPGRLEMVVATGWCDARAVEASDLDVGKGGSRDGALRQLSRGLGSRCGSQSSVILVDSPSDRYGDPSLQRHLGHWLRVDGSIVRWAQITPRWEDIVWPLAAVHPWSDGVAMVACGALEGVELDERVLRSLSGRIILLPAFDDEGWIVWVRSR